MYKEVFAFLERHNSLILTTHEKSDADGLGAEIVFFRVCLKLGKKIRILNTDPVPERFAFMDPQGLIETLGQKEKSPPEAKEDLPEKFALVILDTSDEYNIGKMRDYIQKAAEVFVIDHHEKNPFCIFPGIVDSTASSTCELAIEIAAQAGLVLDRESANAAYGGIIYDTGSFAYSKTTARTFKAALSLLEAGVIPYHIHHEIYETASTAALLLQKKVLASLELYNNGRTAVQILRKEDLLSSGAFVDDAENFINVPLGSRDINVSVLVKESGEGQIRCSLRSKGTINVSKIAQSFGGGGHVSAAGFRSKDSIENTLEKVLKKITEALDASK
jgi:phosphoesterase RecJ-like protein